jgi:predicted nucleotidyltransferase component of viral defense system
MSVVRALLTQVGFGADLDLDEEERVAMMENGQRDALTEVTSSMIFGVVTIMGPRTLAQHNGCPVCVLEGTLERAVDEMAAARMRKN